MRRFAWGAACGALVVHLLWGLVVIPREYQRKQTEIVFKFPDANALNCATSAPGQDGCEKGFTRFVASACVKRSAP